MKHQLTDIAGIGESTATLLAEHGIDSVKTLEKGGVKGLMAVPGFGQIRATTVLTALAALKSEEKPAKTKAKKEPKSSSKKSPKKAGEVKKNSKKSSKAKKEDKSKKDKKKLKEKKKPKEKKDKKKSAKKK